MRAEALTGVVEPGKYILYISMTKKFLSVVGIVFIIVGLLGFFNDPVLGLFEVDTMHNIIHLLSGILALIFASQGDGPARMFAKVFGAVYALVAIIGFVQGDTVLGIITINTADNYLHVLLALLFFLIGFSGSSSPAIPVMQKM
jgi:hypothetical protein